MPEIKWISWEDHRRTKELANALKANLVIKKSSLPKILSHLSLSLQTVIELYSDPPKILFVQNPSVILSFITAVVRFFLKYTLVVDRHSNFILYQSNNNLFIFFWKFFSNFSIKFADLTIVTNDFLKNIVEGKGGRGFVLPDKLPTFYGMKNKVLKGKFNVVFICTYANDEPYLEVIEAVKLLPLSICIYVTGRIPANFSKNDLPENLILTDYLSDEDFVDLLFSADAIMDFTTREWCLVCGGYEAISLGKPLITSDTIALRELFGGVAIYSDHSYTNIAGCIQLVQKMHADLTGKVLMFRKEFSRDWEDRFAELQKILSI